MNYLKTYHQLLQKAERNRAILSDLESIVTWLDNPSHQGVDLDVVGNERGLRVKLATLSLDTEKFGADIRRLIERLLLFARADFQNIVDEFEKLGKGVK